MRGKWQNDKQRKEDRKRMKTASEKKKKQITMQRFRSKPPVDRPQCYIFEQNLK